jgi:hypothetical protein
VFGVGVGGTVVRWMNFSVGGFVWFKFVAG